MEPEVHALGREARPLVEPRCSHISTLGDDADPIGAVLCEPRDRCRDEARAERATSRPFRHGRQTDLSRSPALGDVGLEMTGHVGGGSVVHSGDEYRVGVILATPLDPGSR